MKLRSLARSLCVLCLVAWTVRAAVPADEYEQAAADAGEPFMEWAAASLLGESAGGPYAPRLMEGGRVLLWSSKPSRPRRIQKSVGKTCKFFDKLLPVRPSPNDTPARTPRTAVLFEIEDPAAFRELTDYIGRKFPYLAGWSATAGRGVGFVLEDPLAAAWLLKAPGLKEWNPENETVNRLAQMLLVQRFGRMPQWLTLGLAWYVELGVCKDIYCFPFRSGFVGKKEHKGWGKELAALVEARGEIGISINDLAAWPRGTYDDQKAALAWGAGVLLGKYYAKKLPEVMTELAALREKEGRVTHEDGSWELIPDYEIPAAKQLAILNEQLGIDFEKELARLARAGRSYSRPR